MIERGLAPEGFDGDLATRFRELAVELTQEQVDALAQAAATKAAAQTYERVTWVLRRLHSLAELEESREIIGSGGAGGRGVGRVTNPGAHARSPYSPSQLQAIDAYDQLAGTPAPKGRTVRRILRRLRHQRPDLHHQVLTGALTPAAAMEIAGFLA